MILEQTHNTPSAGHRGSMKTFDLLSRTFHWPNSRTDVLRFCTLCRSCQAIKVNHCPPQGQMMALQVPNKPWSRIGVNFIVKLPLAQGFDSVTVFVDHFSKKAHFIPVNETWKADKLAEAFIFNVFKLHRLPDAISSDRGSTFMSQFWTSVLHQLQIRPSPSTAFHPQTNGQVETINALLEDYLRHFVSLEQDDWSKWLPLAEFSYNNTPSSSTKFSWFFAVHSFHPCFNSLVASSSIPAADDFISHIQNIQSDLIKNLTKIKESQPCFYIKGRSVDAIYQPGDYLWLSRRHIKTRRPNSKLDVRRLGPFVVKQMVCKNAVKLSLPPSYSRLHPLFNVSFLMPYLCSEVTASVPPPISTSGSLDQFVDWAAFSYVLDYRKITPGVHEYLIKGQDSSSVNNEWKLLTTLSPNLDIFLQRFHRTTPFRGSGPSTAVWQQIENILV